MRERRRWGEPRCKACLRALQQFRCRCREVRSCSWPRWGAVKVTESTAVELLDASTISPDHAWSASVLAERIRRAERAATRCMGAEPIGEAWSMSFGPQVATHVPRRGYERRAGLACHSVANRRRRLYLGITPAAVILRCVPRAPTSATSNENSRVHPNRQEGFYNDTDSFHPGRQFFNWRAAVISGGLHGAEQSLRAAADEHRQP